MKALEGNGPVAKIWGKWGAEISVVLGLLILWKLWGFFSGLFSFGDNLTGGLTEKVQGMLADAKQSGQNQQDKAKIKTLNPKATDADILTFRNDAEGLAQAIGRKSWAGPSEFTTDRAVALNIAKKYSKWLTFIDAKHVVHQLALRKESLMLPVLYPFYSEITGGNSLMADLERVMNWHNDDICKFYKKYVKP